MNRFTTLVAVAISLASGPVLAGNIFSPPPDSEVVPTGPVEVASVARSNWSGPYAGLFLLRASSTADAPEWAFPEIDYTGTGYGIRAGYDFAFGKIVAGGFFDFSKSNGEGTVDNFSDTHSHETTSESTLGLRVGYDMGRVLPYAFYGVGRATGVWGIDGPGETDSDEQVHSGRIMGLGAEIATGYRGTTVDFQYRSADYGGQRYDPSDSDILFNLTSSRFSLGVNKRF